MRHKLSVLVAGALLGVASATPVLGQQATGLVDVSSLALPTPVAVTKVDAGLAGARGEVEVVVRLAGAPLAIANGANSKRFGGAMSKAQQADYSAKLRGTQSATMAQIAALGGRELGRVRIAYNALIVRIDAAALGGIAAIPAVESVKRVGEYRMDLSETVPYIGAAAVQSAGYDGGGVSVAVLDSGIDYTHRNLGGAGTLAAYQDAYGTGTSDPRNTTLDGLFPTAKVVGGFDFVGESWPNGPRTEDPDPIDLEGHGTHVADIIAGRSTDGAHKGVAPGASLYAVKVCSAVSSSCNGVALLKGVDFALDPNGDGAMDDAVDVVNMSLGSSYGQREDDLSFASANAVKAGVVVVVSAGNSADRPYIVGSPSSTPEVISVAQTQVPSAVAFPLVVTGITPSVITNTATVEWAPVGSGFSGQVVRLGTGCPGQTYFNGNSPAGKVALIDRGSCNVSLKTDLAAKAGAIGVLIANNAPGDAPSFSFGGGDTFVPTLVITQADGNRIKSALGASGVNPAVVATVSPAVQLPLVGSMVASSSRGPSYSFSAIKPDIGAPGASVSAIAGSGTGQEAFGGTSGAAPMVSGAAALLLNAYPNRTPLEIKAMLMNTANTTVYINPATQPGVLAPITRIGGGEVRVNDAIRTPYAAWDSEDPSAGLSFGYRSIVADQTFKRSVVVKNYTGTAATLPIAAEFRYANDAASGAVEFKVPKSVSVPANGTATFTVMLKVNAAKLPAWNLGSAANQGNGALLQGVEFDGYLTLGSGSGAVRLPWQILPHKSAAVSASGSSVVLAGGTGAFTLANTGATAGRFDVFALTGQSPKIQKFFQPGDGDNFALIDLKSVGVRPVDVGGGVLGVQFAINTFGERAHPSYPAEFDVYVDSNNDGTYDYVLYTIENGGFGATGQTVVTVANLSTGTAVTRFFANADLNSGNMVMTALASDLGLTAASKFTYGVYAFDNYFTGNLTDAIENMTFTLGTPKYQAAAAAGSVPVGGGGSIGVQAVPNGAAASPSQSGLLLLYTDAKAKAEAQAITISP